MEALQTNLLTPYTFIMAFKYMVLGQLLCCKTSKDKRIQGYQLPYLQSGFKSQGARASELNSNISLYHEYIFPLTDDENIITQQQWNFLLPFLPVKWQIWLLKRSHSLNNLFPIVDTASHKKVITAENRPWRILFH